MKRVHGIVRGVVQGVSYRANTVREAERLGLCGWVRNLADGSVEFVAEGESAALERLVTWARKGPPGAVVDDLQVDWSDAQGGEVGFRIRR